MCEKLLKNKTDTKLARKCESCKKIQVKIVAGTDERKKKEREKGEGERGERGEKTYTQNRQ